MEKFEDLLGQTIVSVEGAEKSSERITITTSSGATYILDHISACCESVSVEEVVGNVSDIINTPILLADESSNSGENAECESYTWTFYRLATIKGTVVIRWFGTSNGYYSESVDFRRV